MMSTKFLGYFDPSPLSAFGTDLYYKSGPNVDKGGGVKKSENFADVISGSSPGQTVRLLLQCVPRTAAARHLLAFAVFDGHLLLLILERGEVEEEEEEWGMGSRLRISAGGLKPSQPRQYIRFHYDC